MLRKPLLTTREVAVLLKIKEATVRRWIRNGELPALNLGREWRIAAIQLEEFLKLRATAMLPVTESSNGALEREARGRKAGSNKPSKGPKERRKRKTGKVG